MRRSLAVLAMVPVLMANQCYPGFNVHTAPGPRPMQAVFIGERGGEPVDIQSLSVSLCRSGIVDRQVWSANRKATDGVRTDSVAYGEASKGFFSETPPEPLRAGGCYEVFASGRIRDGRPAIGSGAFRMLADGRVVNGGRGWGYERQVDRAAVGCRRGYRRARTPADSAAVDARVWTVADTTLDCALLRRRDPETLVTTESTERLLLEAAAGIAALAAILTLESVLHLKHD